MTNIFIGCRLHLSLSLPTLITIAFMKQAVILYLNDTVHYICIPTKPMKKEYAGSSYFKLYA